MREAEVTLDNVEELRRSPDEYRRRIQDALRRM
jgi:hypothetical protein